MRLSLCVLLCRSIKHCLVAECSVCTLAESERTAVRKRLEAMRDQLVQNYVQEQQRLYSELIPEVNAVLLSGSLVVGL